MVFISFFFWSVLLRCSARRCADLCKSRIKTGQLWLSVVWLSWKTQCGLVCQGSYIKEAVNSIMWQEFGIIWKQKSITKTCLVLKTLLSVCASMEIGPLKTFHVWEEGERLRSIRKTQQPGPGDMCSGDTIQRPHCSTCWGVFWPEMSSWAWGTSSVTVYREMLWFNVATFKKRQSQLLCSPWLGDISS